jgi:hypothetical protein
MKTINLAMLYLLSLFLQKKIFNGTCHYPRMNLIFQHNPIYPTSQDALHTKTNRPEVGDIMANSGLVYSALQAAQYSNKNHCPVVQLPGR